MADQIPLYPVRSAAAASASHRRAAYYSATGPGPGADRRGRHPPGGILEEKEKNDIANENDNSFSI